MISRYWYLIPTYLYFYHLIPEYCSDTTHFAHNFYQICIEREAAPAQARVARTQHRDVIPQVRPRLRPLVYCLLAGIAAARLNWRSLFSPTTPPLPPCSRPVTTPALGYATRIINCCYLTYPVLVISIFVQWYRYVGRKCNGIVNYMPVFLHKLPTRVPMNSRTMYTIA